MEFDRIYAEVDLGRIEENMEAMKEQLGIAADDLADVDVEIE